jgi:hypothetical protein
MRSLIFVTAAALALVSCNQADPPGTSGDDVQRWTDPSTGCVYYVYGRGFSDNRVGSLSIRYRADGTPDCPGDDGITQDVTTVVPGAPAL